jgi:hypothetical protein
MQNVSIRSNYLVQIRTYIFMDLRSYIQANLLGSCVSSKTLPSGGNESVIRLFLSKKRNFSDEMSQRISCCKWQPIVHYLQTTKTSLLDR